MDPGVPHTQNTPLLCQSSNPSQHHSIATEFAPGPNSMWVQKKYLGKLKTECARFKQENAYLKAYINMITGKCGVAVNDRGELVPVIKREFVDFTYLGPELMRPAEYHQVERGERLLDEYRGQIIVPARPAQVDPPHGQPMAPAVLSGFVQNSLGLPGSAGAVAPQPVVANAPFMARAPFVANAPIVPNERVAAFENLPYPGQLPLPALGQIAPPPPPQGEVPVYGMGQLPLPEAGQMPVSLPYPPQAQMPIPQMGQVPLPPPPQPQVHVPVSPPPSSQTHTPVSQIGQVPPPLPPPPQGQFSATEMGQIPLSDLGQLPLPDFDFNFDPDHYPLPDSPLRSIPEIDLSSSNNLSKAPQIPDPNPTTSPLVNMVDESDLLADLPGGNDAPPTPDFEAWCNFSG